MDQSYGFQLVHKKYDDLLQKMISKGKIPFWSTEKGSWGGASLFPLFSFFNDIQLHNYDHFLDLGSGDGRVVLLASLFTKASGVEFDKDLVEKSKIIRDELNLKAKFHRKNYMDHDFSQYDVIFINPDKKFSEEFEEKLANEMKGSIYVYGDIYKPEMLKRGKSYHYEQLSITRYGKVFI